MLPRVGLIIAGAVTYVICKVLYEKWMENRNSVEYQRRNDSHSDINVRHSEVQTHVVNSNSHERCCALCRENIDNLEPFDKLPCGDFMHKECSNDFFIQTEAENCPRCRTPVNVISIRTHRNF